MIKRLEVFAIVMTLICAIGVPLGFAEKPKVVIGQVPRGQAYWTVLNMTDKGIYKKWGDKINVEYKVIYPGDDFAAFMGRSLDVSGFAPMELARLYAEENKQVVMFGKYITNVIGWYVRADSTAKTPVDLKGKKLGIPGWDTAAAQVGEVIMKDVWGLNIKKDFDIYIGPWPALPKLLAKGDLDMIFSVMPLTLKDWMGGKIKPMFESIGKEYAKHSDGYFGGVQFLCAWKDWLDKNENVASNILKAYQEGIDYGYENTNGWVKEYIHTSVKGATEPEIKFMVDHHPRIEYHYKNVYLNENFINQEIKFLKKAEDMGILPKGGATKAKEIFRIIK